MFSSRRTFLNILCGALYTRFAASAAGPPTSQTSIHRYNVTATVTLLSVPLVSRAGVGSGYISIEDSPGGRTCLRFAAGSWPEKARGLNRLGYIEEVVRERSPGEADECTYFAFMTSSQERNLEQAKQAVSASSETIPYAAAEAEGAHGRFRSRLIHLDLPSTYTWRDTDLLIGKVRAEFASAVAPESVDRNLPAGEAAPSTFLYAVRQCALDPAMHCDRRLVYNGKRYLLRTRRQQEAASPSRVFRLDATLRNELTGHITPFAVWFEEGAERQPPLRFEYQARSFLRLRFDSAPAAPGVPSAIEASAFIPVK